MRILKKIVFWVFFIIGLIILTISFFALIAAIQRKMFLHEEYILWIFKSPFSSLIFIYEIYFILGFSYIFSKYTRKIIKEVINSKNGFIKRHKIIFISVFAVLNIVLIYTILFNVTVVGNNKIINYTFLSPKGKEYTYKDIVKIEAGIHGKRRTFPYLQSKGDFYYIIQLKDGTKIDLNEVGGIKNNDDPRFVLEELDRQYVDMGISKVASMKNFEYTTEHLDKIYTDKIKSILENK